MKLDIMRWAESLHSQEFLYNLRLGKVTLRNFSLRKNWLYWRILSNIISTWLKIYLSVLTIYQIYCITICSSLFIILVYYCAISWDKDHTCILSYNVNTENKTVFTKSWNEFIGGRTILSKEYCVQICNLGRMCKTIWYVIRKRWKDKTV